MKNSIIAMVLITMIAIAIMVVAVPITTGNMLIITGVMVGMMVVTGGILKESIAGLIKELHARQCELETIQKRLSWTEHRLEEVNTLDDVTGCYNRRHFLELMQHHRGMAERGQYTFTVCAAELDKFDALVEHYGRTKGDEILKLIASIVKSAVREIDSVARIEGAQFGILLAGATEVDSVTTLTRVSQLISQIRVSEDDPIEVTASAGVAGYTDSGEDDHYGRAVAALEYAIEQGRNRVAAHIHTERG
jgi:diguanylate cyclase (GGDEF)-like protein